MALNEVMLAISGVILVVVSVLDVRFRRLPNSIIASGIVGALVLAVSFGNWAVFLSSLFGLLVGLVCFFPFYFVGATAAGDVKLIGLLGAWCGLELIMIIVLWSLIVGGVLGFAYLKIAKRKTNSSSQSIQNREASNTITKTKEPIYFPYAPAITVGAGIAIWLETGTIFGV